MFDEDRDNNESEDDGSPDAAAGGNYIKIKSAELSTAIKHHDNLRGKKSAHLYVGTTILLVLYNMVYYVGAAFSLRARGKDGRKAFTLRPPPSRQCVCVCVYKAGIARKLTTKINDGAHFDIGEREREQHRRVVLYRRGKKKGGVPLSFRRRRWKEEEPPSRRQHKAKMSKSLRA